MMSYRRVKGRRSGISPSGAKIDQSTQTFARLLKTLEEGQLNLDSDQRHWNFFCSDSRRRKISIVNIVNKTLTSPLICPFTLLTFIQTASERQVKSVRLLWRSEQHSKNQAKSASLQR